MHLDLNIAILLVIRYVRALRYPFVRISSYAVYSTQSRYSAVTIRGYNVTKVIKGCVGMVGKGTMALEEAATALKVTLACAVAT